MTGAGAGAAGMNGFNPPPRRGRGGIPKHCYPMRKVRVSIRRRVVDAAEWWRGKLVNP